MSIPETYRILHVTNRWETGGTPRYIHDLSTGMRRQGSEVSIAAWCHESPLRFANESVVRLPLYRRGGVSKSLPGLLRSNAILRRVIREHAITILHSHSRYVLPLCRWAAAARRVAHVHTIHNQFQDHKRFPFYPRHLICPANTVRRSFLDQGRDEARYSLHVIYHGLDFDAIRSAHDGHHPPMPENPPVIVFLGRHSDEKGGQILIQALTFLDERTRATLRVRFFGNGIEKAAWMQQAREAGLFPSVQFHATTTQPLDVLSQSDIAIFPSAPIESFGYSFLEAAALGRIVIASDIPVFRELQSHGIPCILFPQGDASALSHALMDILRQFTRNDSGVIPPFDPSLFTLERMIDQTNRIYALALEDTGRI